MALFQWAAIQQRCWPELELLFAIPNGGHRVKGVAVKLQREGVRAGVPDIFLPVARGDWHGLFIEMKAEKGKVTEKQEEWHERLKAAGYLVLVCYGWEAARKAIESYLIN